MTMTPPFAMVMVALLDAWFGAPGQSGVAVGFPDAVKGVRTGVAVRRGVAVGAAAVLPQAHTSAIAITTARVRFKLVPRPRTTVPYARQSALRTNSRNARGRCRPRLFRWRDGRRRLYCHSANSRPWQARDPLFRFRHSRQHEQGAHRQAR